MILSILIVVAVFSLVSQEALGINAKICWSLTRAFVHYRMTAHRRPAKQSRLTLHSSGVRSTIRVAE
jgi:hypothetical protein